MIKPRWRKVFKDIWGNKTRTVLVILSISIGVFAIGMIVGTRIMLREDLSTSYAETNPASAVLFVSNFDETIVDVATRVDGVLDAQGRRSVRVRVQVGPDEWKSMEVEAMADYDDLRLNKIAPVSGDWPPAKEGVLLERASLGLANADVGDDLIVERTDGRQRTISVGGIVHDLNREPAQFTGRPVGFVTLDTLEWLGFSRDFDELHILVAENQTDKDHIEAVAKAVEDKLEKSGFTVFWTWLPEPGEHPAQSAVDPMLVILGVLGGLALFASSFLVINIINGLLSQHVQQIGIMKAIGARKSQITQMYLVTVGSLGVISLFIAVPLGGLAAYGFTSFMAGLINFDLRGFRIPSQSLIIMVAVGIFVPIVASLFPIFKGAGITVREAISDFGLGKGQFGASVIDRFVSWVTSKVLKLTRPMQIALRNTIRRKARLIFTLITMILGGSIFIGILSVHASLLATLDSALDYFAYDVEVDFNRYYRVSELQRVALQIPGVAEADSWIGSSGRRVRPDGQEGPNLSVLGTVADTNLIQPQLLQGRWLREDDTNAIVLNTEVTKEEEDVSVGDTIVLNIDGREREWRVVGLVKGILTGPLAYANRPFLERELRQVGKVSGIQIITAQKDAAFQSQMAKDVKIAYEEAGFQVQSTGTIQDIRDRIEYQFNLIVVFLAVMAILIALVGGLGLMGTMSINVLERTREIGVMRAVGASDGSVLRIVLVEGIFVGFISWILGGLLAMPIGKLLSNVVGTAFLQSPLTYVFSYQGAIGWLAAVLIIAVVASFLPARKASRLSVRETLAYE